MITDLTSYRQHVDQFDLDEKQKLELVNAIWAIAESVLDQHFNPTPAQKKEVGAPDWT